MVSLQGSTDGDGQQGGTGDGYRSVKGSGRQFIHHSPDGMLPVKLPHQQTIVEETLGKIQTSIVSAPVMVAMTALR